MEHLENEEITEMVEELMSEILALRSQMQLAEEDFEMAVGPEAGFSLVGPCASCCSTGRGLVERGVLLGCVGCLTHKQICGRLRI